MTSKRGMLCKVAMVQVAAALASASCGGRVSSDVADGVGGSSSAGAASVATAAKAIPVVDAEGKASAACHSAEFIEEHNLCGTTTTGAVIARGVACTAEDPQSCYRICGPSGTGHRKETCVDGYYTDDYSCAYDPACDYSCFKIPDIADPACPTALSIGPREGSACLLPPCVVCGVTTSGLTTGYRMASDGNWRAGPCVCAPAVIAVDGTVTKPQRWSCTGGSNWPCPYYSGCQRR